MPAVAATVSASIRPVVLVIFAIALKATKAILTFMMVVKTSMSVPLVHLHALGVASIDEVVSTAGAAACHTLAQ